MKHDNSYYLLGKLDNKQKSELYEKMADMIIHELNKPVRYALRVSLIMFASLLFLPHHPSSILIGFGIGLVGGLVSV